MSRTRVLLFVGLIIGAAACASLATLHRERISFVGKCWQNGNPLAECSCTFTALKELPDNYRAVATSWAHDTTTVYAGNLMYLIVAEAHRTTLGRMLNTTTPRKTIEAWVWNVGKLASVTALQKAAPALAAKLAPAVAILPPIYDATAEFGRATTTLDRHCGRRSTIVATMNDMREAAEKVAREFASGTMEMATDAASTTVEAGGRAAIDLWGWLRSKVWN